MNSWKRYHIRILNYLKSFRIHLRKCSSNNIQMSNWSCAYVDYHHKHSTYPSFMTMCFYVAIPIISLFENLASFIPCTQYLWKFTYSYENVAYFLFVFYHIFLSVWILDFNKSCILMKTSSLDLDFWASLLLKQCHGWLTLFMIFDC